MCTISWLPLGDGYRVFFNRDEQKTRAKAEPPRIYEDAIYPRDPQGGGTWIAANRFGLTLALLNFYQGRFPKGRLRSRGELVRNCAQCISYDDVVAVVENAELKKYPPFSLLVFEYGNVQSDYANMLRWTGKQLEKSQQTRPLFSSFVRFDEVCSARGGVFNRIINSAESLDRQAATLRALHASHEPEKSALSMCMHREEAQTVSYSEVDVTENAVNFSYADGPPCESKLILFGSLERSPFY